MGSCAYFEILIEYAFGIFLEMIALLEMDWGELATTVGE